MEYDQAKIWESISSGLEAALISFSLEQRQQVCQKCWVKSLAISQRNNQLLCPFSLNVIVKQVQVISEYSRPLVIYQYGMRVCRGFKNLLLDP